MYKGYWEKTTKESIPYKYHYMPAKFSNDTYPTVVSALGGNIKGDRLGLGVNLFSSEKTLAEERNEYKNRRQHFAR